MEINEGDSSSGQNQDISATTQKIVDEIKSLEKELETIQTSCSHPSNTIKNCPQGLDNSFNLKKVCDRCQAHVGYPTPEEISKWVNS